MGGLRPKLFFLTLLNPNHAQILPLSLLRKFWGTNWAIWSDQHPRFHCSLLGGGTRVESREYFHRIHADTGSNHAINLRGRSCCSKFKLWSKPSSSSPRGLLQSTLWTMTRRFLVISPPLLCSTTPQQMTQEHLRMLRYPSHLSTKSGNLLGEASV